MRNFVQHGNTMTFPAPYAVDSGGGAQVGSAFGVASYPADPGVDVELVLEGVFTLPRTGAALNAGDPVFWDDTGKAVTGAGSAGMLRIGIAATPAAADSPTADVRLNGSF